MRFSKPLLALSLITLAAQLAACAWPTRPPARAFIPSNIEIDGNKAFASRAKAALDRILRTSSGRQVLSAIGKAGRSVTIQFGRMKYGGGSSLAIGDGDSIITWDPDFAPDNFPPFLGLYHELIHALQEAQGLQVSRKDAELRAIGIGPYSDTEMTENALRKELGLPLRTEYGNVREWAETHSPEK